MRQEVLKVTYELIGPQTNNILLITLGETMSQEVFSIIGPKIFWPQLLI